MSRPSPRTEIAYRALREAILEQALQPGTKLPEDEIGAHFSMSRTLARAVLVRLQAEGLVETPPKRTATVAQPTIAEAHDVFEVRRALEAEMVRLVIKRWKPAFGAELEGLVRAEDEARAAGDGRRSIRLAGEFHIRLAALSGNKVLEKYMAELVTRCSLILAVFGRPHSSDGAVNEHSEIIAALRKADANKAVALMNEHMSAVEHRALFDSEADEPPALGDVLSRYAEPLIAKARTTPMRKARGR